MLGKLLNRPRKPKVKVPIRYCIGWWSDQDTMKIDSFTITIIESNLTLFNSKSLISYTLKGHLTGAPASRPYIKEIQHCEKVIQANTMSAVIDLTPVVKLTKDKNYCGDLIQFEFTNEHIVQSMHWGPNSIMITCGGITREIILLQKK
jgi:hypothetical protein